MDDVSGGNLLAYAALLAWPILSIPLYRLTSISKATAWTILGALLFLPPHVAIKVPMLPAIDKASIGSVCALLGCLFFSSSSARTSVRFGAAAVLAAIFVLSPVVTSALNNDAISIGVLTLPGVGYYDGVSTLLSQLISLIPFYVGARFLNRTSDVENVLHTLAIGGLIYTIPMLFEIRMSPQLSQWIYGTFSSSYAVEARYGGYRPVVFMTNGLEASFLLSTSFIAAAALAKARCRLFGVRFTPFAAYVELVLVMSKSAGALIYSILAVPATQWWRPKTQIRIALVIATTTVVYPVLRMYDWIPTNQMVQFVSSVNEDRSRSLKVRLDQEERLLNHASERLWFGWGRYGRNRVYDETGYDITITDGQWIITLSQFGIVGFFAQFGLLTLPVFVSMLSLKAIPDMRGKRLLGALVLILSITAFEQLPNASINPWSWLVAGVLFGVHRRIKATLPQTLRRRPSLTSRVHTEAVGTRLESASERY